MDQAKNNSLSGFTSCLLFLSLLLLNGCMAASLYNGKPGLDVGIVKEQMSRTEVERILGSPIREWNTPSGVVYRVYDYDAGVPPSTGDAAAIVFLDAISLGLSELIWAFTPLPEFRKRDQMAVSYDGNDRVLGVFDHFGDFDVLPADGRPDGNKRR